MPLCYIFRFFVCKIYSKNIKSQVRKQEKTKENRRKQEKVKSKLKFLKKCVDKGLGLWYDIQADAIGKLLRD